VSERVSAAAAERAVGGEESREAPHHNTYLQVQNRAFCILYERLFVSFVDVLRHRLLFLSLPVVQTIVATPATFGSSNLKVGSPDPNLNNPGKHIIISFFFSLIFSMNVQKSTNFAGKRGIPPGAAAAAGAL